MAPVSGDYENGDLSAEVGAVDITAEQIGAARLTVCEPATDAADARALLEALGIMPDRPAPPPAVYPPASHEEWFPAPAGPTMEEMAEMLDWALDHGYVHEVKNDA